MFYFQNSPVGKLHCAGIYQETFQAGPTITGRIYPAPQPPGIAQVQASVLSPRTPFQSKPSPYHVPVNTAGADLAQA